MELAAGVELATTAVPYHFLPLACATNVAKNVGAVTSTSTRTPIYKAFSKGENIGDVTAKEECVGNVADLVEDQTKEVIFDHLHATAFQHTPLGRTILGPAQNVRTITKDHLQKYISTHYTTSRMVIVASEAVKHEDLVEQVKKLFTKLSLDPTTTSELVSKGLAIFSRFFVLKSFGFLFLLFFLFFLRSDNGCFGSLLIFCIKWGSGERERRVMLFCGFVYKVVIF
ncbi:mitochondrial-processing peptidase subunit beta-like isoform X1 [Camellia sinensis]|uniref:mitochondrial-processing peptidase subunit beta-like isoform X1 n=1 Tax=Camellia sinensis TaxID=4442 RepID=UPI001035B75D|nr:mitochondrial-processing peptidase subunit beta-like isoform X1 [Camellia sinensis]XP_028103456.1 mitochondrial-processing peptidase subunit beta-like isoform X1 [Camellia sinensis]